MKAAGNLCTWHSSVSASSKIPLCGGCYEDDPFRNEWLICLNQGCALSCQPPLRTGSVKEGHLVQAPNKESTRAYKAQLRLGQFWRAPQLQCFFVGWLRPFSDSTAGQLLFLLLLTLLSSLPCHRRWSQESLSQSASQGNPTCDPIILGHGGHEFISTSDHSFITRAYYLN